ncbi:hypothetical protein SARC_05339 [Sphaeroforma arctica JP610]|uniref:Cation-transporting P-type ATPase C-terminal domain-containing protein n=1 Tax=Sphaeroforma arctica JP610 TaxID=667725 RepID=A0A0L0G2E9_9EUKA|nr:hypothetical protein SARC_05339 [Sphaeroforma arctica JP610]KNC82368.1 hypothetical protein SARC_05339 [Sphaeroforma arctica JP610]|eukprot:XP_014156270.1 hypothetical protein SARC_05339 [Sphaeroforma arctica JP610]
MFTSMLIPFNNLQVYSCHEVNSGEWELAVAGANTYDSLLNSGDIAELLSKIRIFARMSPEGKVSAVEMHKKAGIITGMCGDGGNDAGALRAAHAGMALSDAEASIVSPFTSKSKSVQSVVDLLLDGRACLHTSFAMYKFLVSNGLVLSLTKLIILFKGVLVCIFGYLMIDLAATLTLGYTMVLARPPESLKQIRPTSSLLGPITLFSVLGVVLIDFAITIVCLMYAMSLANFVPWPSEIALGRTWWYLSDNWEASILYFTQMGAYLTNALAFSLGSYFRLEIYRNIWLMIDVAVLYAIQLLFLLMAPNAFTDAMHVASIAFNRVGTDNPIWQEWQSLGNPTSPGMSFWERFVVAVLLLLGTVLAMCYQRFVIDGPVGRFFQKRAPSDRPRLNP